MDIRDSKYHGLVKLTGVANPIRVDGSIMSIFGSILSELRDVSPRVVNGSKQLNILISDSPITQDLLEDTATAREVESQLVGMPITTELPMEGEDMPSFMSRLTTQGYSFATAQVLACDAFGYEVSEELTHWLTDPQAVRFRALHASQAAHDAADPQELAVLESYCKRHHNKFYEGMKLKS